MSLCINPDCKKSNPDDRLFCESCGSEILLLGRYKVVRLLSEKGGFADTYEVTHHGVPRVLKVLKDRNPKAIELFKREYDVLHESNHPGIPKAEEYFEFAPRNSTDPLSCLVMEKILGGDLEEYLRQRGTPIDERCAIDWLDQVANILKEIHDRKLLHRDIKPSNIILQPDGQLVLIDFGAVGRFDAAQAPATFIFTPGYAATEQTMGRATPQSDYFSLGRTFVYLLTGKQVGAMLNTAGEFNWQTYAPHISTQLGDFINKLMNPDVNLRPQNADELIQWVVANRLPSISSSSSYYPQPTLQQIDINAASTAQGGYAAPTYQQPATQNAQPVTAIIADGQNRKMLMFGMLGCAGLIGAMSLISLVTFNMFTSGTKTVTTSSTNKTTDNNKSATTSGGQCGVRELVRKSGNLFGAIEIGSKGIKGAVIQELDTVNEDGFKYKAREEKEGVSPRNVNATNPTAQADTVKAVSEMMKEIQDRFSIPCEQIVIYGSSGLAKKATNKDAIVKEVEQTTGREMKFISADDEGRFVFDGVVPEWRRGEVITVDIGSGNTKGTFLKDAKKKEYENYAVDVGTGDFSREIDKKRGSTKFTEAAEKMKKDSVVPQIRDVIQRKAGILNSPRIYLAGGISWALATLTHPCDKDQTIKVREERVAGFTKLRAEDITTFYNNATRDRKTLFKPNLSACTPEQLKRAEKDIAKIEKDVFSENDLIAGAEILRAFSEELKFSEKESIFFARYAIEALPIGYLIQQLEATKK
jgi:serine/threonine protein kinase